MVENRTFYKRVINVLSLNWSCWKRENCESEMYSASGLFVYIRHVQHRFICIRKQQRWESANHRANDDMNIQLDQTPRRHFVWSPSYVMLCKYKVYLVIWLFASVLKYSSIELGNVFYDRWMWMGKLRITLTSVETCENGVNRHCSEISQVDN